MTKIIDTNMGKVATSPSSDNDGQYSELITYKRYEMVLYDRDSWVSKKDGNKGHTPADGSQWWFRATNGGKYAYQQGQAAAASKQAADDAKAAADQATADANAAAALAQEVASHPSMIDAFGWIYEYNITIHDYEKTNKNIAGRNFQVDKVFESKAAMDAYVALDPRPADDKLIEGRFFVINTGSVEDEDTGKLYQVSALLQPQELIDMSGMRGFTGHTPQFSIGTVTTGLPGSQAQVSISPDGEDAQGNPKYKLNLVIPKGDKLVFADLTAEDIAVLQAPALEAAETANEKAALAAEKAALANEKAALANEKALYALSEGNRAKAFNDHPWEIRNDGYIYVWDETHDNGDGSYGAMVRTNKMIVGWSDLTQEQKQAIIDEIKEGLVSASVETCETAADELT